MSIFNQYRNTQHYNSFIFGSSRTLAFKTDDWRKCINTKNFNPFIFNAANESIYGIEAKVEYLNTIGAPIENAIIIICSDVTFRKERKPNIEHFYIKHPKLSTNSWFKFHFTFIKAYAQKGFFIKYFDYKLFRVKRNYMLDCLDFRSTRNDLFTNDLFIDDEESGIVSDSINYYNKYNYVFYKRPEKERQCLEQIMEQDISRLRNICDVFKLHNTRYKIIVGPLYDQKKLNPADLLKLYDIFGKENVYDYSGQNEITENKYNYFESSHYRYRVGEKIMKEIYSPNSLNR